MRVQTKRKMLHTRTPEQIERSYRQMLAMRDIEQRREHWLSLYTKSMGI
ncbi:MAG: hypothetical protein R2912_02430 [Eubacteriales bacterium]